ncbi:MAG: efflux RND transporter permease subunit [Pseudomonadota bacterium]
MLSAVQKNSLILVLTLVALTLLPVKEVAELKFSGVPKKIFEFQDTIYSDYLWMADVFPATENTVVIVIEGSLFDPEHFNPLLQLETDLKELETVSGIASIFSLPEVETLLNDDVDFTRKSRVELSDLQTLKQRWGETPPRLVGKNQNASMFLVELETENRSIEQNTELFEQSTVQAIEKNFPQPPRVHLAGTPMMQLSIDRQLTEDTLLINIISFTLATVIALILFRSVFALFVLSIGPTVGVIWTLAVMSLLGDSLSILTAVVPPLLFVLGYTNSAHILFEVLANPDDLEEPGPLYQAIKPVLKACLISALTTGIGFGSLLVSSSPIIREFGFYCSIGCLITFVAVAIFTPIAALATQMRRRLNSKRILKVGQSALSRVGGWVTSKPRSVAISSLVMLVVLSLLATQNHFNYSIKENFSKNSEYQNAIRFVDQEFGGSFTATVMIEWQDDAVSLQEIVNAQQTVENVLRSEFKDGAVFGLKQLLGPLANATNRDVLPLQVPSAVLNQLIDFDRKVSIVTLQVPDTGSHVLIPKYERIREALTLLEQQTDEFKISLTGISPIAVYSSDQNIKDMTVSLFLTLIVVFAIMIVFIGSWRQALISMFPNILPIVGVAALLVVLQEDLYFNNLLVFAICLGIAIDDTVHYVMRYKRNITAGKPTSEAIKSAISSIGLVLIFTSLIIGAGFFALTFSSIGVVSLMGTLAVSALVLALIADLVILPAFLMIETGAADSSKIVKESLKTK